MLGHGCLEIEDWDCKKVFKTWWFGFERLKEVRFEEISETHLVFQKIIREIELNVQSPSPDLPLKSLTELPHAALIKKQ